MKKIKIVLPKYRCRNYLERKSKSVAEVNIEKSATHRKKRKIQGDKCLPLKKRGRLGRAKVIYVPKIDEIKIEPNTSDDLSQSTEVLNELPPPMEVDEQIPVLDELRDDQVGYLSHEFPGSPKVSNELMPGLDDSIAKLNEQISDAVLETRESLSGEDLISYLASYRLQTAVLWAGRWRP